MGMWIYATRPNFRRQRGAVSSVVEGLGRKRREIEFGTAACEHVCALILCSLPRFIIALHLEYLIGSAARAD